MRALALSIALLSLLSCTDGAPVGSPSAPDPSAKITFDLSQFDADGLRGPPDGLRSLSYEFCIPDTDECRAEVKSIDPSVQFMCGSAGRIGCSKTQCLTIGSTHQEDFRGVLGRLAELDYIHRIDECFFE